MLPRWIPFTKVAYVSFILGKIQNIKIESFQISIGKMRLSLYLTYVQSCSCYYTGWWRDQLLLALLSVNNNIPGDIGVGLEG